MKYKTQAIINLIGLSLGILVFIVITSLLVIELTTDQHLSNYKNIYSISLREGKSINTPAVLAPLAQGMIPEFKEVARCNFFLKDYVQVKYKDKPALKSKIGFVDASFLKIFTPRFISGDPETCLREPYTLVLTRSESLRIFGKTEIVGEELGFMNNQILKVTGVIEDVPVNSSIQYAGIASFESLAGIHPYTLNCGWSCWNVQTFVLLDNSVVPEILETKLNTILMPHTKDDQIKRIDLYSLHDLYFDKNIISEFRKGNKQLLWVLGWIAVLVLSIAVINYINLSTSRSLRKSKEVGLRKVIGSTKLQIMMQILGESFLMALVSINAALILYQFLKPVLSRSLEIELLDIQMSRGIEWILFIGFAFILSILSGLYPAIQLSKFKPVEGLRREMQTGRRGRNSRRWLITIQFAIAIVLIITTTVIYKQVNYFLNKDLGFQKENILVIQLPLFENVPVQVLKQRIYEIPAVIDSRTSLSFPGNPIDHWEADIYFEGKKVIAKYFAEQVEPGYLEMMGFDIKEGRTFSDSIATDYDCVVINEAAVKEFEIKHPLDARFPGFKDSAGYVIGVVKDFYFESLHNPVRPMVFHCNREDFGIINVKMDNISSAEMHSSIKQIRNIWEEIVPGSPFEFRFLDQSIDELYKTEWKYRNIFLLFSLISIFIACMGLFGLASFTVEQRFKEIGIRKVNGSGSLYILYFLLKDYIYLLFFAFLVAAPVSWYLMTRWLESFVNKINMAWWTIPMAFALVLIVAVSTVFFESYRASRMNPVDALRYE